VLAALLFEIPLGLAVLELGSRNPGEGGLYLFAALPVLRRPGAAIAVQRG